MADTQTEDPNVEPDATAQATADAQAPADGTSMEADGARDTGADVQEATAGEAAGKASGEDGDGEVDGSDASPSDTSAGDGAPGAPGMPGDDEGEASESGMYRPKNGAPYDFTRPWTLSNRFNRNMTTIGEAFANQLSFTMSNYLRTSVDVVFRSVKQELFKDHLASLPEHPCMGVFSLQPLKGQSMITVDASLMFVIMEKLIGGAGKPVEIERDFTEIETRVFMTILGKILGDLRDASRKFFDATPSLSRIENNPSYVAVMTPSERAITLRLHMTINEAEGDVLVSMPMAGFDPVMDALDPREDAVAARVEPPPEERAAIASALADAHVEVSAILGAATITLDRLLGLRVGDAIVLEQRVGEPVPLRAGRVTLSYGEPGKSQNRKALRLVSGVRTEVRS